MVALDERSGVTHHLVTHFAGHLDEAVLREAWRSLGHRHPILLATLSSADRAWISTDRELGYASVSVADRCAEERVLQTLCASRLGNDPVGAGRLTFLRRGDGRCSLVLSFHHAVVDGRGTFVILDDLRRGYLGALHATGALPEVDSSVRTIGGAVAAAGMDGRTKADLLRTAAHRWANVVPSSHWAPRGDGTKRRTSGCQSVPLRPEPAGVPRVHPSRSHGWTPTDMILGALAHAWEEAIGRDH